MSATALPITSSRFAAALRELPISSLHAKVSELQNAIAHLEQSNEALEEFVREEDDKDCYEALMENREVVSKNKERIELIRKEVVELRGLPWIEGDVKIQAENEVGSTASAETGIIAPNAATSANGIATATENRQPREHINGTAAPETEEGVFL